MNRRILLYLIGLFMLVLVCQAWAQKGTEISHARQMTAKRQAGRVSVSASFPEMFTKSFKQRLSSGFTCQILSHVSLYRKDRKEPIAQSLLQTTIIYKIWEEFYYVRIEGQSSKTNLEITSLNKLIETCGTIDDLPLQPEEPSDLNPQTTYYLRVRITINPTSETLRRKVRDYLAQPEGRGQVGSPRSFFGSFSKIFVSERDFQADAILNYESQKFKFQ